MLTCGAIKHHSRSLCSAPESVIALPQPKAMRILKTMIEGTSHELLKALSSVMPHCPQSGGTCRTDSECKTAAQDVSTNRTGSCVACCKLFASQDSEVCISGRSVWLAFSFAGLGAQTRNLYSDLRLLGCPEAIARSPVYAARAAPTCMPRRMVTPNQNGGAYHLATK